MADDDVVIGLRTRGARKAAKDVDEVADSVKGLGKESGRFVDAQGRVREANGRFVEGLGKSRRATKAWAMDLRSLKDALRTARTNAHDMAVNGIGRVTSAAKWGTAGLAGMGIAAETSGLAFNAQMEQYDIAFTNFLGSQQRAKRELAWLSQVEQNSPFDLPGIVDAERKLLSYGLSAKRSRSILLSVSDAAAGAGLGADKISDMIRVIGQIRGKGKLYTEELQQLGELGVVNRPQFAKNLGLSNAELADAGMQGISAERALRALQKTWDDQFGGQAVKQAKSFNGQLSSMRSNLGRTLGTISKPGFDWLRGKGFPAAGKSLKSLDAIFGRDDIDLGEKLTLSRSELSRNFAPLADEIGDQIDEMQVGPWIRDKVEEGTPVVLNAAGELGKDAAVVFVKGWWEAGPWGKLITAGFLAGKLGLLGPAASGAFGWAGKKAAGQFKTAWRKGLGKLPAPVAPAVPIPGGAGKKPGGGTPPIVAPIGRWGRAKDVVKKWGSRAAKGGAAAGPFVEALVNPDEAGANSGRAAAENARRRVRENARRREGRAAAPPPRGDTVVVLIDGEPVAAKIVRNHGRTLERGTRRVREDREARR